MEQNKIKKYALFFVNSLNAGGAEKVTTTLASELARRNFYIVFVTLFNTNFMSNIKHQSYLNKNNSEEICLNINNNKISSNINSLKNMLTIKSIIIKNKQWQTLLDKFSNRHFDLITAHLPLSHKLCMLSPWGNKAFYVMHTTQEFVPKLFRKAHCSYIKKYYEHKYIVCVSNGILCELTQKYDFDSNYVLCIHNPIEHKYFSKNNKISCNDKTNVDDNTSNNIFKYKPYMVMVGRLCKVKRQDIGIRLFKEGKFYKTHNLIILGDGPWKDKLIKYSKNIPNVHFIGKVDNVDKWMKEACLLLSTSEHEGLPLNLIEALKLNTPVVSTNCHFGPSEILTGPLSSFLDPSVETIKAALNGKYPIIDNNELEKFNPKVVTDKYLKEYKIRYTK